MPNHLMSVNWYIFLRSESSVNQVVNGKVSQTHVHGKLFRDISWGLPDGDDETVIFVDGRPQVVTSGRVTRWMSYDQEYLAVVDEFVEEGENNPEVV
jgi:hypothetical protein